MSTKRENDVRLLRMEIALHRQARGLEFRLDRDGQVRIGQGNDLRPLREVYRGNNAEIHRRKGP